MLVAYVFIYLLFVIHNVPLALEFSAVNFFVSMAKDTLNLFRKCYDLDGIIHAAN